MVDPKQHQVAQRQPQVGHGVGAVEIEIDDVLVFLGRVLGIFHRAVGTPRRTSPGARTAKGGRARPEWRNRGRPQAHVRAPLRPTGQNHRAAKLRVDGVMAAIRAADRIGAADIVRRRRERVVGAFAVVVPIGWMAGNRACRTPCREFAPNAGSHLSRCRAGIGHPSSTGKRLVPAGKAGGEALGITRSAGDDAERPVVDCIHQPRQVLVRADSRRVAGRRGRIKLLEEARQAVGV